MRPISIAGRPVYAMFLPVAVVCFADTVATDLAYRVSDGNLIWLNFSSWLLAAGLLFGAVALVLMLVDAIRGLGWAAPLLLLVAWIVELFNSFIHARDGWTAVVPAGLLLSLAGALLVLASGWLSYSGRNAAVRDRR